MRKRILRFALLAGLAALPAFLACGRGAPPAGGGGALPPEFSRPLTALDGTPTTLAQYQGKVVLVNFWATWCAPCRVEIPWLIEFTQKYGPQGLVVVGVAMDEEGQEIVEPYIREKRFDVNGRQEAMNYQIVLGNDNLAEQFGGIIGLPTSMLYDRDGTKVKTMIGLINHDDLTRALETLF
jgi:cytochrome c biogenesis protein CcmG/thiol:disulfide interchange protein DsbE